MVKKEILTKMHTAQILQATVAAAYTIDCTVYVQSEQMLRDSPCMITVLPTLINEFVNSYTYITRQQLISNYLK
jgi:hypothetical protein